MIGQLNPDVKNAAVVGGGFSGLLAAYRLTQAGYRVRLFEKSKNLGGQIRTTQTPFGIAESAAHSFLASFAVKKLAQEIGLELQPLNPDSRSRFILREGKLKKIPLKTAEIFQTLIKIARERADGPVDQLNLEDWALKFLGPAALDHLINPLVAGIYAASPRELNVAAAFPSWVVPPIKTLITHLRALRKDRSSRGEPRAQMMAPQGGMQAVIEKLIAEIKKSNRAEIHLGEEPDFSALVRSGDNLVLSVPTNALSDLVRPYDAPSARVLDEIQYSSLVTVTVFVKSGVLSFPKGVGYLVPQAESSQVLGVLFNSSSFTDRAISGFESFTVMLGGTRAPHWVDASDAQIMTAIGDEFRARFGGSGVEFAHACITRWGRAIPIYSDKIRELERVAKQGFFKPRGRLLFTNYSGHLSLRGLIESSLTIEKI